MSSTRRYHAFTISILVYCAFTLPSHEAQYDVGSGVDTSPIARQASVLSSVFGSLICVAGS